MKSENLHSGIDVRPRTNAVAVKESTQSSDMHNDVNLYVRKISASTTINNAVRLLIVTINDVTFFGISSLPSRIQNILDVIEFTFFVDRTLY